MLKFLKLVMKLYAPDPDEGKGKEPSDPKPEEKEPEEDKVSLAKALKEARENSVPKSEYEKVVAENKQLVSEIINGGGEGNGSATPETTKVSVEELREKLYGPNCGELSNLDFWKYTLQLRDEVIKRGEPDPFLPIGAKITPTDADVESANRVADVVQECIKEADGNSEVFTALLQGKTNGDSIQMQMHLKKLGIKYK